MRIQFIAYTILALSAMVGCTSTASSRYSVNCPASAKQNGLMAYILDYDTGEKIDSVIVADQSIKMTGTVDKPTLARLMIGGERGPVFILENGDIDIDTLARMGKGTPLNDSFLKFMEQVDSIENAYEALPAADSVTMAERERLFKSYQELSENTMRLNADNPIGYYLFLQAAYEMTLPEFEKALAEMPSLQAYKRVTDLRDALKKAAATGVGAQYTDFAVTYNGKTSRLSDYVGKDGQYTLVDFWASWCGPCIKETRTIKELYNRYGNGKGLNVVGVAVWDEPQNTERAISAHNLPWPQIIDAQKIPTDIYGISGIPCIILIDPSGKIVSRGKQGDELVADVEAALSSAE